MKTEHSSLQKAHSAFSFFSFIRPSPRRQCSEKVIHCQDIDMFTLPTDKPMQNYRNYPKGNRHILSLDGDDNVFGNYCAVKDKIKLCVCAVKQGNFVEGLRIAEETIKLADRHTSAIILQALCLYELRRPQQALDAINQYLVKEKDIHQVWSLKATFLEELGDLEGKKFCQKQMDRTDPDFYFWDFS